jgi:hypothetical protein
MYSAMVIVEQSECSSYRMKKPRGNGTQWTGVHCVLDFTAQVMMRSRGPPKSNWVSYRRLLNLLEKKADSPPQNQDTLRALMAYRFSQR